MARAIFLILTAMIVGSANGQSNHRSSDTILDSLKGSLNGVLGTLATIFVDTDEAISDFLDNKAVVIEQSIALIAQDAEAFRLTIGQVGQSTGLKTNEATKLVGDMITSLTNVADQLSSALLQRRRDPRAPTDVFIRRALKLITDYLGSINPKIIDPLAEAIYKGVPLEGLLPIIRDLINQQFKISTIELLQSLSEEVKSLCAYKFVQNIGVEAVLDGIRVVAGTVRDRPCKNLVCLVVIVPSAKQIVQQTGCGY